MQLVEAWQTMSGSLDYRLQINDISLKSKQKILNEMEGWQVAGEILPATENNNFGLLFSRVFESQEDFKAWYKSFSLPIQIFSSTKDEVVRERLKIKTKKEKKVKEKKEKKEKKIKRKKRCKKTCSLCHKSGHTSPTCPHKEKIKSGKGHKCRICCEFGHNAKTCPENR